MTNSRWRLHAWLCSLVIVVCAILAYPVAEMGMNDDFSYTRSVELLLKTGHIHYVGWAAAMLGWQLYLGVLFAKVFGFSFTAVRCSMLPVAMATAWLLQRTFVRVGINERNATLGALAVCTSPLFLALAFSFMTDVPGMFCLLLCFYCCMRALQAQSDRTSALWIIVAAGGNALDGTVRQSAWLGVAVMVPCACWLLRRRKHVMLAGAVSCAISAAWILWCIRWFNGQPYVLAYNNVVHATAGQGLLRNILLPFRSFTDIAFLLTPLLVAFLAVAWRENSRRVRLSVCAAVFLLFAAIAVSHHGSHLLGPYLGDAVSVHGPVANVARLGDRPLTLTLGVRVAVTIVFVLALISFGAVILKRSSKAGSVWHGDAAVNAIPASSLTVLVLPMLTVYAALLLPRAIVFDRYLLVPLPFAAMALILLYQRKVRSRLPASVLVALCGFWAYGVAATHDVFAMYRALTAAVDEITRSGIPRSAVDGGFEYNGWTQLMEAPALNSPEIENPIGAYIPRPDLETQAGCHPQFPSLTPLVRPQFAVSFDKNLCYGPSNFAPVLYRPWLSTRPVPIYIVRTVR